MGNTRSAERPSPTPHTSRTHTTSHSRPVSMPPPSSTRDVPPPSKPPKPPTKEEIIRNYENYCNCNPDIYQLLCTHGSFILQYSPTDSTFEERTREMDKITPKASAFYSKKKFGISLRSIAGNIFIWDNHVAIAYKDNIRILGVFSRPTI